GRKTSTLHVSHAFHSPLIEPMTARFRAIAESLTYATPAIPAISTVTGQPADRWDTADYWVQHTLATVRFADAVTTLTSHGVTTLAELGPDAPLTAAGPDTAPDAAFIPLQRRDRPQTTQLTAALGHLHTRGATIDWAT